MTTTAEESAIRAGWINYKPGQDVAAPVEPDGSISTDWWYHKDAPDGDWYRTSELGKAIAAA